MTRKTVLFVPVLAEKHLAKASERGADAIVLDLEDSIAPDSKLKARESLGDAVAFLKKNNTEVWVRVNNMPELLAADLAATVQDGVNGVMISKVERALGLTSITSEISRLETARGMAANHTGICATLETPAGVLAAASIAAVPRLKALAFGGEDFAASLGIEPRHSALKAPGQMVVLAAASQGLESWGVIGSIANHSNMTRFAREVRLSRALGTTTVICIHPKQVETANAIFNDAADKAWAEDVIRTYDAAKARGEGSISVDGQMIDEAVYVRAKKMLE